MEESIVCVSPWDVVRIHACSLLLGSLVLLKRAVLWLWSPRDAVRDSRDIPPALLQDPSLGRHCYVKLEGVKFHYVESGSPSNPLLLLLHGFPDCWIGWRQQIPVLDKYFRVVAVDMKGFGDSDKPPQRWHYRTPRLLHELSLLVGALGGPRCVLVGHDLGALLGWFLVHLHPGLVSKFVAIACPHPNIYWEELSAGGGGLGSRWVSLSQLPLLPELEAMRGDLGLLQTLLPHLDGRGGDGRVLVEAYKYSFSRREDWTGPLNYYRNLPFNRVRPPRPATPPCLLVAGSRDPQVSLEAIVRSAEFTSSYSVRVVEGAGHYPHQEAAGAVNRMLLAFLIEAKATPKEEPAPAKGGLVSRVLGAVTSTMRLGSHALDMGQRKAS